MVVLLRTAELIGAQEDGADAKDKPGDELPKELHRRSRRLGWIRKVMAEIEAEAVAAKTRQAACRGLKPGDPEG